MDSFHGCLVGGAPKSFRRSGATPAQSRHLMPSFLFSRSVEKAAKRDRLGEESATSMSSGSTRSIRSVRTLSIRPLSWDLPKRYSALNLLFSEKREPQFSEILKLFLLQ